MVNFHWKKALYNNNVTKTVSIFYKRILNVTCNYIQHETLTYDDKDLPWISFTERSYQESLLQDKNKLYKDCRRNNTNA